MLIYAYVLFFCALEKVLHVSSCVDVLLKFAAHDFYKLY